MPSAPTDQFNVVRDQASQLLQSIIEQATAKALNQTQKQGLSAQVRNKVPFQKKANPTARDLAMNAAAGALELWQAAVDRAEGAQTSVSGTAHAVRGTVSDRASSVGATVTDSAQHLRESAKETASTVHSSVADTAHSIRSSVGDTAQAVSTSVSDAAEAAKSGTRTAVATTASGGRNTIGLLFWTGAAATVVYYAFLDDDLRAKVREVANSALVQAREMLADFQGQDGEFKGQE